MQQHSVITPFPKGSRKEIRQVTASLLSFFFFLFGLDGLWNRLECKWKIFGRLTFVCKARHQARSMEQAGVGLHKVGAIVPEHSNTFSPETHRQPTQYFIKGEIQHYLKSHRKEPVHQLSSWGLCTGLNSTQKKNCLLRKRCYYPDYSLLLWGRETVGIWLEAAQPFYTILHRWFLAECSMQTDSCPSMNNSYKVEESKPSRK